MLKLKDKIVSVFTVIGVTILGMMGGQGKIGGKGTRRFGVPGLALIAGLCTDGVKWKDFVFLLLIPTLVMGYGEKSWLLSVFHVDWLVRLAYAILLSAPFWFHGILRGTVAALFLSLAWQIRAGSLGHVAWFGDILIEDVIRYSCLGVLISYNIFFPRKSESCCP